MRAHILIFYFLSLIFCYDKKGYVNVISVSDENRKKIAKISDLKNLLDESLSLLKRDKHASKEIIIEDKKKLLMYFHEIKKIHFDENIEEF